MCSILIGFHTYDIRLCLGLTFFPCYYLYHVNFSIPYFLRVRITPYIMEDIMLSHVSH